MSRRSYEERAEKCENPLMRKLFNIIATKKTNLCIAADIEGLDNVVDLIHKVGHHICILKVHDSYFHRDNTPILQTMKKLSDLKKQYNFLLFEDNKCIDNGEVTKVYYRNYVDYVDMVTVCNRGSMLGIEAAVKEAKLAVDEPRGALLLCQKSYAETSKADAIELLKLAENTPICAGIIAQDLKPTNDLRIFKLTPGVHLSQSTGGLDQKYKPPSIAIENGSDVIIVGSGIIKSSPDQWLEKTLQYKLDAWKSYLNCLNQ